MIHYPVGTQIAFNHKFEDSNGNAVTVASAKITFVWPSSVPGGNLLAHDPGQLKATNSYDMTLANDGVTWQYLWDSSVSDVGPGPVYWEIVSKTPQISVKDVFVLDGNLATQQAFGVGGFTGF